MNKQTRLNANACDAIQAVKTSIDQQPFERKSILRIVIDTGIGRNLLQKGFKHLFGVGIKEYQKTRRLEVASGLLAEDRLSIQQIAGRCGYRSQSSFTRAFKELYGLTPSEWKNRITNASMNAII